MLLTSLADSSSGRNFWPPTHRGYKCKKAIAPGSLARARTPHLLTLRSDAGTDQDRRPAQVIRRSPDGSSEEGQGKGKGISKEIGVVQITPHKYYRDRVKVSARSPPHLTHNRRSTSPPGHLEESNPPFRRVHKVSEGHCYTETEYPLR